MTNPSQQQNPKQSARNATQTTNKVPVNSKQSTPSNTQNRKGTTPTKQ